MKRSNPERVKVSFWGVRGSIPSFDSNTTRYGANTACVSLEWNQKYFICDAGTGIRMLGHKLFRMKNPISVFISHLHWDHIFGLPFFEPIYQKGRKILMAGPSRRGISFKKELSHVLRPPYFPVGPRDWRSQVRWRNLNSHVSKLGEVAVESKRVDHPGGALAFQFSFPGGKRIIYATDHNLKGDYASFCKWIRGCDLLIHDAQFDRRDYARKKDWGHSPYESVLEMAMKVDVKKLVLFHHDPNANDRQLAKRLEFCRKRLQKNRSRMQCLLAKEGLVLRV